MRSRTADREIVPVEEGVLHGEGLTMDEIGRLFGVTRQRVSALLRGSDGGT